MTFSMSYSAEAPRGRCVSPELAPAVGRAVAEAEAVAGRLSSWCDQEGLVEAALEAVWKAHQEYRPGAASFLTFALERARLAMLTELRGQRRWHPPQGPMLSLDALAAENPKGLRESDGVSPEDAALRAVDRRLWEDAMAGLPGLKRQVMELRLGRQLTQSEVADRLGISERYVKKLEKAARALLRAALEGGP